MRKNGFKINNSFSVALSFPGEYRDYVRQVYKALSEALNPEEVFFDECYEHIIAGIDGDTVLQRIYHDQSEMIVVFLCKEYEQKEWCCNVEWRAIRDLIKKSNRMNILLLRFDNADIRGVYSIDIVPNIHNRTPQDTSQLILARLQYIRDNCSILVPETIERLGELHNVPPLPNLEKYLIRTEVISTIKKAVLEPVQANQNKAVGLISSSARVGFHGMGGIGKTVLAAALANEEEIRKAFPDGIFWLTIGRINDMGFDINKPNMPHENSEKEERYIVQRLRQLILGLDPDANAYFDDIQGGRSLLERLLKNKACLVILDDVWSTKHAAAFNVKGTKCQFLITTRIGQVIKDLGSITIPIDLLNESESKELLAKWAGQNVKDLPELVINVIKECGYLALALSMIGAMVSSREDKNRAWSDALEQLKAIEFDKIINYFPDYQYPHLFKAIKVSIDDLGKENSERYLDFVVFQEDQAVPEALFETFWKQYNMPGFLVRNLLNQLVDRSLASRDDKGQLYLHDLQFDFICKVASDDLHQGGIKARHNSLLQAYFRECDSRGWPSGPDDDYFYQNLFWQLRQAGREVEILHLLWNPQWYRAKIKHTDIYKLINDFGFNTQSEELKIIQKALELSANCLVHDPTQLASQLIGRLLSIEEPGIQSMIEKIVRTEDGQWLRPLSPTLSPPGGPLLCTFEGHTDVVNSVVVTVDGKVVSASNDKTIKVWDINSGELFNTLEGHTASVISLAVTDDGKIVSASKDNTLKVWDLNSCKLLYTLEGHTDKTDIVAVTDDGKVVSTTSDNTLKVWDINSGKFLHSVGGYSDLIEILSITEDGKVFSVSFDNTLMVWDINTGKLLNTINEHISISNKVTKIAGDKVVSFSSDGTLKVWNINTGKLLHTLEGQASLVNVVAVTDDGKIFDASYHTLMVWDITTGKLVHIFEERTFSINCMLVTNDGKVISASDYKTLRVSDINNGKVLNMLEGHTNSINAIAVTADDKVVSASNDKTLKVWNINTNELLFNSFEGHTNFINSIVETNDGKVVFSTYDGTLEIWDINTGKLLNTLEGHPDSNNSIIVKTANGKVVSASYKTIKIWDVNTGTLLHTFEGHNDSIDCIDASDGNIVSTSYKTIKIWDLNTGNLLHTLEGHTDFVRSVAVTISGKIVSESEDGTLRVWDINTGMLLYTFNEHTDIVAVTADGKVVFESIDKMLKIWNIDTCELLHILEDNTELIYVVGVTTDGKVITETEDNTLKIWDVNTGEVLHTVEGLKDFVYVMDLTYDGNLISVSENRTLNVWNIKTSKVLASFSCEYDINIFITCHEGPTIVAGDEIGHLHFLRFEGF